MLFLRVSLIFAKNTVDSTFLNKFYMLQHVQSEHIKTKKKKKNR